VALLHARAKGEHLPPSYATALRKGAAKARGGAVPSIELMCELLGIHAPSTLESGRPSGPGATSANSAAEINAFLRDAHVRTPPVLKAAWVAGVLLSNADEYRSTLASLAVSLILCAGGATADPWITLPIAGDDALARGPEADEAGWTDWLRRAFSALARESRAAEHGLSSARQRIDGDRARIGESLGRAAYSALDLFDLLADELVVTIADAARTLGQTPPTTGAAVARLEELGVVVEITGQARSREFAYVTLVDAFARPASSPLAVRRPP
jgi:hypothetical protein